MVTLEINEQTLVVTVEGMDKLWALRSSIVVPLAQITGVTARPDISKVMYMPVSAQFRGVQNPGSVVAGTLVMADGSGEVFCDVHDDSRAVAIELQHHEFKRLVVEVSGRTPEQARDLILDAVGASLPPSELEGDVKADDPRPVPAGTSR